MSQKSGGDGQAVQLLIILSTVLVLIMALEYSLISGITYGFGEGLITEQIGPYLIQFGDQLRWMFLLIAALAIMFIPKGDMFKELVFNSTVISILAGILCVLGGFWIFSIRDFTLEMFKIIYPLSVGFYVIGGLIFASVTGLDIMKGSITRDEALKFPRSFKKHGGFLAINFKSRKDGYINIINIFRGIQIFGNAGSGKTWFFFKPMLEFFVNRGFTGLVYDFKAPELIRWIHDSFHNYKVKRAPKDEAGNYIGKHTIHNDHRNLWIVNFSDLSRSHRVNPIEPHYLATSTDANEIAITILHNLSPSWKGKEDFWAQSAVIMFKTIIWFLRCEYPQQCTLPHAVAMSLMPFHKVLAALQTNRDCAQMIEPLAVADRNNAEGQISGQVTSLQAPISKLNTPEITWVLSDNDFYLDLNDAKHPGLLVISNSPKRSETYGPILSLISSMVMKLMNDPSKKDKLHSVMALDEAHSLYIPGYDKLGPATSRSEKVAHIFCSQSRGQVYSMYGQQQGSDILATIGNQIQLATTSPGDANEVSAMIGGTKVKRTQLSVDKKGKITGGTVSDSRELYLHPEDVYKIDTGRGVGLLAENDGGKFPLEFSVKPDIKPKEHEHEFQPFVKVETDDGGYIYPTSEDVLVLASAKHDFIRDQVTAMVESSAVLSVLTGKASELKVFPEHFNKEQRIKTAFGDPIDAEGNVISRFSGIKIGNIKQKDIYFDVNCIEADPMATLEMLTASAKGYKKAR